MNSHKQNYENQLDVVFSLYEQKAALNKKEQRKRWIINLRLLSETEKARELEWLMIEASTIGKTKFEKTINQ